MLLSPDALVTSRPSLLVGRDEVMSVCRDALDAARSGTGGVVVVRGGVGVGKSSALREFGREAEATGTVTVLSAVGTYGEQGRDLGLVERLFPELGRASLTPASAVRECRDGEDPVVLVVDELQWADRHSLQWLSVLAEQAAQLPVLLVVAVCDGAPGSSGNEVEDVLYAAAHHVRLGGLDRSGVRVMLERLRDERPSESTVTECLRTTGGVPLLVTAFANVDTGSVALSTRVRLRRMGSAAEEIFACVAVFGTVSADAVARFCGRSSTEVIALCATLQAAGLIECVETEISVAHPLVRQAVLGECPPAELRALQGRAARFRHTEGARPADVAQHLLQGETGTESWAAEVLRAAAENAMTAGDPDLAVRLLRRALAESRHDRDQELTVRLRLAEALARTDVVEASRTLVAAVRSAPPATAVVDLGLFDVMLLDGRGDQAAMVAAAADKSNGAAARVLARTSWRHEDLPEPLLATEDALISALGAMNHAMAGRSQAAVLEVAAELSDRPPIDTDVMLARIISTDLFLFAGGLASALDTCDPVVALAESLRHRPVLACALAVRAHVRQRKGELVAAALDAERALDEAIACGLDQTGTAVRSMLARLVDISLDMGDTGGAADLLRASQPIDTDIGEPGSEALLFARGRLRATTGDFHRARADLMRCGDLVVSKGIRNPAGVPWQGRLAVVLAAVGAGRSALDLATTEIEAARRWGAPATIARALLTGTAVMTGDAMTMLDEAAELLTGSEDVFLLSKVLLRRGRLLSHDGDVAAARTELRRAHEIAAGLECDHLLRRIRAEIAAAGGRPPKPSMAGVGSLTGAESRVARLAARGHKNREIARALFVQERTVEVHLTRTYRKLGIESRAQLAGLFGQEGVPGP
ncbi:LuxR C-terminal-related transcriptional regulator [Lentzea sp. JNUCC 0626]|uniref:LuxR C-terminal-related transcriptional regulator n=1 Tax=Lentzea sp. JNUCC 0626 TaxID=3367513 RepID=UPI0037478A30